MTKHLLLIGGGADSAWVAALRQGLRPLAALDMLPAGAAAAGPAGEIYDLILLDYSATEEAGRVLRELRRANPRTPVIVVSAAPTWQQAKEVFSAGAADYISKSLDAEELHAVFEEILSRFA